MRTAWKLNEYEKRLIARRYAKGEDVRSIAGSFDIAWWIVGYHARLRGVPLRRKQWKERRNGAHRS
jgi:hypothetical protein